MAIDLPLPGPSKESDIPDAVKRARAIANGDGQEAQSDPVPSTSHPKRTKKSPIVRSAPTEPQPSHVNVTIDGTDFNLVMQCSGVDIKAVHGQDAETLALGVYRFSPTRFTPKTGSKFRITPHAAGMAYDVTFLGFSFDVGDIVVHAFVIDAKQPVS